jgi:hypothetical protein
MTPLEQIAALVQAGHWLPVILLVTMVVRKWVSADSKFPVSVPKTWQLTVTAVGGLGYGLELAIQAGSPIGSALLDMAVAAGAGGFLDGMLVAIFDHDNAPVWARSIVFVFDDLTGQTPVHGAAKERLMRSVRSPPLPPASILPDVNPQPSIPISVKPSEPPPRKTGLDFVSLIPATCLLLAMALSQMLNACSGAPVTPGSPVDVGVNTAVCVLRVSIEDELAGMKPDAIVLDCIAKCGATAAQVTLVREQYASSRALERSKASDGGK